MKHLTVKEKEKMAYDKMKSDFHYKNVMAAPRLKKIVINVGTGTMIKKDKNKNDSIQTDWQKSQVKSLLKRVPRNQSLLLK